MWRRARSGSLIAARFIQGIGAAIQASVILAIIVTEFPIPSDRARAMSAYVFVAVAGGSLGLLAGGALTELLSWHWIFFVNLPIGAATFALGSALIPPDTRLQERGSVDWLGSALVTISLMTAIYAIVQASGHGWSSEQVLAPGAIAVALMAAFVALEARLENPIMPLRILQLRGLIASSAVRGFLVTGMYSTFFLGTLYLEHVRHYGALQTGLSFLPWTLTVATLSLGVTARLVNRFGAIRVLVPGMTTVIAGLLAYSDRGPGHELLPDDLPRLSLHRVRNRNGVHAAALDRDGRRPAPDAGLAPASSTSRSRSQAHSGSRSSGRSRPPARACYWAHTTGRQFPARGLPPRLHRRRAERDRGDRDRALPPAHPTAALRRSRHRLQADPSGPRAAGCHRAPGGVMAPARNRSAQPAANPSTH